MFVESLVRLLIAEHKKSPISGNVLALGKQSVALPLSRVKEIFEREQCEINPKFTLKIDTTTRYTAATGLNEEALDDEAFFRLFGDINYQTMDVSSYEQASIIHNLNYPIPQDLEGKFDYVIDGGTFDHLFDLKTCFENVVKLLKPGGRIFQWNAASNYANAGYLSFSADFFYDYYALNKFADCRTYFALSHELDAQNWCLYEFIPPKNGKGYPRFKPSYLQTMVIVSAKKGTDSTYHRMPIQLQYRDEYLQEEYKKNAEQFESTTLVERSNPKPISLKDVKMPFKYKLLYLCELKPAHSTYHKIGWL